VRDVTSTYKGKLRKKKGDSLYAPQDTPCTLPQEKQNELCVIANAHSECVRIKQILKSQTQRGIKYPEEKMSARV
jgi:hypothetical protein